MCPVDISNADRVLFPEAGITKGDVVGFYERAGAPMLRHLAARPLTLERFPRGIGAKGFMQKNAPGHFPPSIERVEIPKRDGATTTYPVVHEAADIAYLANQGTITFHVWPSVVPDLWRPDRIIFDLDPETGDTASAREAAYLVRVLFDEIGLPSTPVATGSKGYHVVAPITPTVEAERVGRAMQGAALLLAARSPKLVTVEFRKANRKGRVFLDWLRNQPGSTSVCPFSLRARPGAPVAVPLSWDELATTAPDQWRLDSIDQRLDQPDPLAELAAHPVPAGPVIAALEERLAEARIEPEPFDRFRS